MLVKLLLKFSLVVLVLVGIVAAGCSESSNRTVNPGDTYDYDGLSSANDWPAGLYDNSTDGVQYPPTTEVDESGGDTGWFGDDNGSGLDSLILGDEDR
ncbi:MAG: hypothetical protein DRP45_06035 [Candidatus Zixiibacteriota bacterium]|nr:MAG: hypothetical protein DRP45_06035 [candidate division Zixibacteria bacterium]